MSKFFILSNNLNVFDSNLLETGLAGAMDIVAVDENGELFFSIWNLRPPYQIIKKRNSNIMLIIKENDTINVKITGIKFSKNNFSCFGELI